MVWRMVRVKSTFFLCVVGSPGNSAYADRSIALKNCPAALSPQLLLSCGGVCRTARSWSCQLVDAGRFYHVHRQITTTQNGGSRSRTRHSEPIIVGRRLHWKTQLGLIRAGLSK